MRDEKRVKRDRRERRVSEKDFRRGRFDDGRSGEGVGERRAVRVERDRSVWRLDLERDGERRIFAVVEVDSGDIQCF